MLIYYYRDFSTCTEGCQSQFFFTGKTAAEKARRQLAREYFNDKTERDWWLNEHPVRSFDLKGKNMIVHCLNQAAADGYISSMEHAEEI